MTDNDPVQYGILGSTQAVRDDGSPVPLGGPRLRALLAALALRAGRTVPAWALIEEIWAGDPPADPQDALQTLVARLRRALGPEALVSAADGYRLTSGDTDLSRFEALAATPEGDAESLRSALELWRGPALADLPTRADAAARCEVQRAEVQRRLLAAELARGRASEVLRELAELTARHPLDEALQALRLRALRDSGRTPEALLAYEEFRRRLADTLGTDPGPELRALHGRLLTPSPQFASAPAPAAPAPAVAAPDPGRAAPPAAGVAPDPGRAAVPVAPALRAPQPPQVTNLRPRLTSFVGRDADLAGLRAELPAQRLLTLIGPGGSGKTRLAQQAAEAHAAARPDDFPDGVWLVELAALDDPRAVPGAVLSALGLRSVMLHVGSKAEAALGTAPEADTTLRLLLDHCANRRLLLVLDNCEHLVQAAAELAERLTATCPGVAVLATSREPLGVPGEVLRPVDPLPDPAALRLLAERGAATRPGFDPTDPAQDPEACAEICRRLDGLPLAIELAAARLRALTPRQLADRLDSRFQLLTGGSRTNLPRQQTLRAVVDWSWELLDASERTLLARLSVFSGGCTLEAVERICADGDLPVGEIAPLLASLVDKSLVQASLDADTPRYRMLETIHEYAAERFHEAPGERDVTLRHLVHYRELARRTDPLLRGGDQLAALALLEAEHDNLRAALRRAIAAGDEQEALSLVLSLGWFWSLRHFVDESRAWYRAVAALGPEAFPAGRPVARAAPLPRPLTDVPPPWSDDYLEDARRSMAVCQFVSEMADFGRKPTPEQVRLALALVDAYPPDLPQSARLASLHRAYALLIGGHLDRLHATVNGMVDCCRAEGCRWELAFVLQLRSKLYNDQPKRQDQAALDAAESLALFTELGDRWGMAQALAGQSEAAAFAGDYALSAGCARQAIVQARILGATQEIPLLMVRLGDALLGVGDLEEGERCLLQGISDASVHGPAGQGTGFFGTVVLAVLRSSQDRLVEARELLTSLLPGVGQYHMDTMLGGLVEGMLGWLDAKEGRPGEGLRRLRSGLTHLQEHPMAVHVGEQLELMLMPQAAYILLRCAELGDPAVSAPMPLAARLLGAFGRLQSRHVVHHTQRDGLDGTVAALRERLGPDAYAAAHAEGATLDVAAAVSLLREAT